MANLMLPRKLEVQEATYNPATSTLGTWTPASHLSTPFLLLFACMARAAVRTTMSPVETLVEVLSAFYRYTRHLDDARAWLITEASLSNYYKDAQKTALSGRIGDALGLRMAMHLGYRWFLHFEDANWKLPPPTGKKRSKQPDYLVFTSTTAAVLECKGSLTKSQNALKTAAKGGLEDQVVPCFNDPSPPYLLSAWMAVGSMVKPTDNLLALVNLVPPSTPVTSTPVTSTPPPSGVIPMHYARWLKIMGLHDTSEQLVEGNETIASPELRAEEVNGRTFLFSDPTRVTDMVSAGEEALEFGIDQNVLQLLLGRSSDEELTGYISRAYPQDEGDGTFSTDGGTGVVLNDGTAVQITGTPEKIR